MKRTLFFLSCLMSALADFFFACNRTKDDLAEANSTHNTKKGNTHHEKLLLL